MNLFAQYAVASALYGTGAEDGFHFICTERGVTRSFESLTAAQQYIEDHELNFTNEIPKRPAPIWFPCLITEVKVA